MSAGNIITSTISVVLQALFVIPGVKGLCTIAGRKLRATENYLQNILILTIFKKETVSTAWLENDMILATCRIACSINDLASFYYRKCLTSQLLSQIQLHFIIPYFFQSCLVKSVITGQTTGHLSVLVLFLNSNNSNDNKQKRCGTKPRIFLYMSALPETVTRMTDWYNR